MNFDFSEDQKHLRAQAQKFLSEQCSTKVVRRVLDSGVAYDKALWKAVAAMGWTGTAIPEAYGGLGLGSLELCVIAEELGRAVAPIPFSSSVYLAAEALMLAGSEAQKKRYLPKLASGEMIGTLAAAEGPGAVSPRRIATRFAGGKLDGEKKAVPDGASADLAVVLAKTGPESGDRSLSLVLVELGASGVKREAEQAVDLTRPIASIAFAGTPGDLLGKEGEGLALLRRIFDRAAVLFAFEQVGGAEAALEMARQYALGRIAFGRPIASFQAIKHKLAEMYGYNVIARSNSYYAAWALSTEAPELPLAAAAARVSANKAFDFAAQENIQTHGGVGFTWEYDCHFYLRRARQLSLVIGSSRVWREQLVSELEKRNAA